MRKVPAPTSRPSVAYGLHTKRIHLALSRKALWPIELVRPAGQQFDEAEALARLGWNFNQFDRAVEGDPKAIASARAKRLIAKLDKNGDGRLDSLEFGPGLREKSAEVDVPDKQADVAASICGRSRTNSISSVATSAKIDRKCA